MAKPQLLIFDFDGTLVDTAPDLIRSANLYLTAKGFDALPEERIRAEIGMGLRKLIVDVYPGEMTEQLRQEIEKDFIAVYEHEYLRNPVLFHGAEDFFAEWEGSIAIVSNKRVRFIHPILEKLGLAHLPWVRIIGGDTYPNMKPHPEPFLGAIEAAGVTPGETLIIGDGIPDVEGALAIDSRCIAVEFGYTPVDQLLDLGAWKSVSSFADLLPLIRSIT